MFHIYEYMNFNYTYKMIPDENSNIEDQSVKIQNTITDSIADTLYIPLLMKCKETKKKDAFFHDDLACDMVDKIDYDFSKYRKAVQSSVGVALRAKYFDMLTAKFIKKHTNPVVIHIGCGLDTRFHRLRQDLTDQVIFYELDIPEVIELRKKLLVPSLNNIYIASSMFEIRWMKEVTGNHPKAQFLFIAEGVFMYFVKEQIKEMFDKIAQNFSEGKIIFDVTSNWMCKNSHRHETVKLTKAEFKFGCDDDKEMENWNDSFELECSKQYSDFKEWKRVGFMKYWAMKKIPTFRNSSRLLCYKF